MFSYCNMVRLVLQRRYCRQPFVLPTPYIPRLCGGLFIVFVSDGYGNQLRPKPFGLQRRHCRQRFMLPPPYIPRLCGGLFIYCRPRCQLDYGLVFFCAYFSRYVFILQYGSVGLAEAALAANDLCYPPPISPACAGDCCPIIRLLFEMIYNSASGRQ